MKYSGLVGFVIGAVAGAAVTYYKMRNYYEGIIDAEIQSVRDMYQEKHDRKVVQLDEGEEIDGADKKPDLKDFVSSRERTDYTKFFKGGIKKPDEDKPMDTKEEDEEVPEPYVISEEAFNEEKLDYDKLSFTFYNDGVLTDDSDHPVDKDEIDDLVGNALRKFDDPEVNIIFVRNDMLCVDYEIARDLEDY